MAAKDFFLSFFAAVAMAATGLAFPQSEAGPAASARAAPKTLKATTPSAGYLEEKAVAVLVFPDVTKAGFLIGGEYGNGVMFRRGQVAGYYRTGGISYGLQAGMAKSINTTTLTSDSYAFIFGQQGLMAGVGFQGTKITKLKC